MGLNQVTDRILEMIKGAIGVSFPKHKEYAALLPSAGATFLATGLQ